MRITKFNIRVYGICINNKQEVLITDEYYHGKKLTKFPGGGLEYGEGTIDCLKRECREELGQEIEVIKHFYTTDYFQATQLLPTVQQLISIYYLIKINKPYHFKTTNKRFDFDKIIEGAQTFRWIPLEKLNDNELTLPVDKKVGNFLKEKFYLHLHF